MAASPPAPRLVVPAVLAVIAVVATGCAQGDATFTGDVAGTSITFSVSVPDEERPAIREVVRRFQDRTQARVDLELLTAFGTSRWRGSTYSRRWTPSS